MGASILAYIRFDDNSPSTAKPFTNEASVWSLEWDYGLYGCKDYLFIAAISGVRNVSGKQILIPLRGTPKNDCPALKDLIDEPNVGYLTHSEILKCLGHMEIRLTQLHRSVLNVLDTLSMLAGKYGDDRVQLVFNISD